jgi:hypothetical protein
MSFAKADTCQDECCGTSNYVTVPMARIQERGSAPFGPNGKNHSSSSSSFFKVSLFYWAMAYSDDAEQQKASGGKKGLGRELQADLIIKVRPLTEKEAAKVAGKTLFGHVSPVLYPQAINSSLISRSFS